MRKVAAFTSRLKVTVTGEDSLSTRWTNISIKVCKQDHMGKPNFAEIFYTPEQNLRTLILHRWIETKL